MESLSLPAITPLFDAERVQEYVADLARQIDAAFAGSDDLVLIGVLRGAIYLLADLSRALATPHRIDVVEYTSYDGMARAEGRLVKDCSDSIAGADVVIVDDVFDTGVTLGELRAALARKRPRRLALCTLFVKGDHPAESLPEFHGPILGPAFLVGYGMDLDQRLRHLPYVGVVAEDAT